MRPVSSGDSALRHWLREGFLGRFPRGVWVLSAIQLISSAGFSICLPFLPLYLHQDRGLTMTVVGSLFLISGVTSSFAQMAGGLIADRFGRRRLLLGASALRFFIYAGLAGLIATGAPVWSIALVFIAGQAVGMTMRPAIAAMIADLTPPARLTETYSLLRVGQNVGWASGPALGGYLLTFMPYAWLFGVTALSSIITLVLVWWLIGESFQASGERVPLRSMFGAAADRRFLTFTLLSLLVFMTLGQLGSTLSVFTVDRIGMSTAQYGMILTANGIMVALLQYPVGRWAGRLPGATGLALGAFLFGLGYLGYGGVRSFGWGIGAMLVVTAGEIVFSPLAMSTAGRLSPATHRGRYMGFFGLSQSLSMSMAPLFGGVLLDSFPHNPWLVWGIISSVAFAAAGGLLRWRGLGPDGHPPKSKEAQP